MLNDSTFRLLSDLILVLLVWLTFQTFDNED